MHEHACHLAVVQPMFAERLELVLREPHPRIAPYSPSAEEAAGSLLEMDLDQALDQFVADRRRLVDRLASLSSGEWHRPVQHPEYREYSIFIMTRMVAMHDLFHGYRIHDLLLSKDWSGL